MEVRAFDVERVPSPWREILEEEVLSLKARPDVLAIGVARILGSGGHLVPLRHRPCLPPDLFRQADAFRGGPARWVARHLRCLDLLPSDDGESRLSHAAELIAEARALLEEGHYRS